MKFIKRVKDWIFFKDIFDEIIFLVGKILEKGWKSLEEILDKGKQLGPNPNFWKYSSTNYAAPVNLDEILKKILLMRHQHDRWVDGIVQRHWYVSSLTEKSVLICEKDPTNMFLDIRRGLANNPYC